MSAGDTGCARGSPAPERSGPKAGVDRTGGGYPWNPRPDGPPETRPGPVSWTWASLMAPGRFLEHPLFPNQVGDSCPME